MRLSLLEFSLLSLLTVGADLEELGQNDYDHIAATATLPPKLTLNSESF